MRFALTEVMRSTLWRFDVFLAVITVVAVSAPWARASARMGEISCLLLLWAAYFGAAAGMRSLYNWKTRPEFAK